LGPGQRHAFKQILLRQNIPTLYNLLEQRVQDLLVVLEVHQLAQADEVAADQ
jgi:hypothetical protein